MLLAVPHEMGAPAVLGVAGEGVFADAIPWLQVFTGVVTPHLFTVFSAGTVGVFFSKAVFDWAGASPARPDDPARMGVL